MSETVYVYLMEDLRYGGVKIGISKNLRIRRASIQKEFHTRIAVRYAVECSCRADAFSLERAMHKRFDRCRADGEWFKLSAQKIMAEFPSIEFKVVDLNSSILRKVGMRWRGEKPPVIKRVMEKGISLEKIQQRDQEITELKAALAYLKAKMDLIENNLVPKGAPTAPPPIIKGESDAE